MVEEKLNEHILIVNSEFQKFIVFYDFSEEVFSAVEENNIKTIRF